MLATGLAVAHLGIQVFVRENVASVKSVLLLFTNQLRYIKKYARKTLAVDESMISANIQL